MSADRHSSVGTTVTQAGLALQVAKPGPGPAPNLGPAQPRGCPPGMPAMFTRTQGRPTPKGLGLAVPW